MDVWFDGQQVVTAAKAKTKADGNTLFFQTGLHRKDPANFDDTIYFDEFIEADTMAEAKIATPSADPSGPAGGMGGMAGAAGAAGGSTAGAAGSNTPLGGTAGTSSAGSPTGGAPVTGTAGTTTSTAGTTPTAGTAPTPTSTSDDSGSCTLAKTNRSGNAIALLTLLGLAALARRRQR